MKQNKKHRNEYREGIRGKLELDNDPNFIIALNLGFKSFNHPL